MQERKNRRDLQKEASWREHIKQWETSGLSIRDFCQQKGLKETSFHYWRRELIRRDKRKILPKKKKTVEPSAQLPLMQPTTRGGKVKQIIRETTGQKDLSRIITAKESVLLRHQLRTGKKAALAGMRAGKQIVQEEQRIKTRVDKAINTLVKLGERNIPPDYKDMVYTELDSLGLAEGKKPMKSRKKLLQFVEEQRAQGEVIPIPEEEKDCPHEKGSLKNSSFAKLLKRVFLIDIEICPHCKGKRKIISAILKEETIRKILSHMGTYPTNYPIKYHRLRKN